MVRVRGRDVVRSYSIVEADPSTCTVRIAVRLAVDGGSGSRYVHGLRVNDRLRGTGARQDFPLDHRLTGCVLVAGGIGITALAAMLRVLAGRGVPVRLVHVGHDRSAMPLLAELSAAYPELVDAVVGAEGRWLDADALVAEVPAGHQLYVCAPALRDLRRGLRVERAVSPVCSARLDLPVGPGGRSRCT